MNVNFSPAMPAFNGRITVTDLKTSTYKSKEDTDADLDVAFIKHLKKFLSDSKTLTRPNGNNLPQHGQFDITINDNMRLTATDKKVTFEIDDSKSNNTKSKWKTTVDGEKVDYPTIAKDVLVKFIEDLKTTIPAERAKGLAESFIKKLQ